MLLSQERLQALGPFSENCSMEPVEPANFTLYIIKSVGVLSLSLKSCCEVPSTLRGQKGAGMFVSIKDLAPAE